jgi:hypothetical protein
MRSLHVVVQRVLGKHAAQVSLPEDQHAVGKGSPMNNVRFGIHDL